MCVQASFIKAIFHHGERNSHTPSSKQFSICGFFSPATAHMLLDCPLAHLWGPRTIQKLPFNTPKQFVSFLRCSAERPLSRPEINHYLFPYSESRYCATTFSLHTIQFFWEWAPAGELGFSLTNQHGTLESWSSPFFSPRFYCCMD